MHSVGVPWTREAVSLHEEGREGEGGREGLKRAPKEYNL